MMVHQKKKPTEEMNVSEVHVIGRTIDLYEKFLHTAFALIGFAFCHFRV